MQNNIANIITKLFVDRTTNQVYKNYAIQDKAVIDIIMELFTIHKIDTPLRILYCLTQACHESGSFIRLVENLNYSATSLRKTFPKHFTVEQAALYSRQPEKIANKAYANRMGNGPENSGDGWKYRGRGYFQLTGANNYKQFSLDIFGDLNIFNNPDLVASNIVINIYSVCWFWNKNNLSKSADQDNLAANTKILNGGSVGLTERQKILQIYKNRLYV
jgi:putative chitinase